MPTATLLRPPRRVRWWRRARRPLAATLVAAAAGVAVLVLAPAPPRTTTALVATRALPAGTLLANADVESVALLTASAPPGLVTARASAVGARLAAPVPAGVPLTAAVLREPSAAAAAGPGRVAAPVLLPDPAVLRLVEVGSQVDVLAVGRDGRASTVAVAAPVLEVVGRTGTGTGLVLLAVPPTTAARLAEASAGSAVSLVLR
jgi:Flp pilus assembly protein CpaB